MRLHSFDGHCAARRRHDWDPHGNGRRHHGAWLIQRNHRVREHLDLLIRDVELAAHDEDGVTPQVQMVLVVRLGEDDDLDLPELILRLLKEGQKVNVYDFDGYWLDIGRHDDYETAMREFALHRGEFLKE